MALTNAEKQASWRERDLKNENGTKLRAQFIFDAQHQGAVQADRLSQGLLGDVSHQGVGGELSAGSLISSRARRISNITMANWLDAGLSDQKTVEGIGVADVMGTLCAQVTGIDRLSMIAVSPGSSVGTRICST
jgi:hypothetical protein